jgi:hypothetical protein
MAMFIFSSEESIYKSYVDDLPKVYWISTRR